MLRPTLGQRLAASLDAVVLGALVLSCVVLFLRDRPFVLHEWDADLVDRSWQTTLVSGALHGDWAGLRFVFTYGAVWQALMAPLPAMLGPSVGNMLRSIALVNWIGVLALTFLALRWLVPQPWVRAAALALVSVNWLWLAMKPVAPAVVALAAARLVPSGIPGAVVSGILVLLAQHLAFDTGLAALAGWLAALLGLWWWRACRARLIAVAVGAWGLAQVVCWVVWKARGVDYLWSLKTSLAILKGYAWGMALPFDAVPPRLVFALAAGAAASLGWLALRWIRRDGDPGRLAALGALWVAAAVQAKSALIRSDLIHIGRGCFPTILALLGTAAAMRLHGRGLASRLQWAGWAAGALALLSNGASPRNYPAMALAALSAPRAIPPGYREIPGQDLVVEPRYHELLSRPGDVVKGDGLYVFPFETIVNVLAGKPDPGRVLQSYCAMGEALQAEITAGIDRAQTRWVLWQTDLLASQPLDQVPALTRSSSLVRDLAARYRFSQRIGPGQFLLESRPASRRTLLDGPGRRISGSAEVPLDGPAVRLTPPPAGWRAPAGTIFALTLSARYPVGAMLFGKPADLRVTYTFATGETREHRVLLEPDGRPHRIFLAPLFDQESLVNIFATDSRRAARPAPGVAGRFPDLAGVSLTARRMGRWTLGRPEITVASFESLGAP